MTRRRILSHLAPRRGPPPALAGLGLALSLLSTATATAPASPLPTDAGARALRELEALDTRFLTPEGEVLVLAEGAVPPQGAVPLLSADPVVRGLVPDLLPTVARVRTWLAWGGDPAGLAPALLEGLRQADLRFAARGLPRPFHPFAYPPDPGITAPLPGHDLLGLPNPLTGWAAVAVREFEAAKRMAPEKARELIEGGPYLPEDPRLKLTADLRGRTSALHLAIEHWYHDREVRSFVDGWLRPAQEHLQAGFHALARAIASAPPEGRDSLAVLAFRLSGDAKAMGFGAPTHQSPAALLGGLPEDPASDLLEARWLRRIRETRTGLALDASALRESELRLLDRAQRDPGRGPQAAVRAAQALSASLDLLRDDDRCDQVARLWRERRPDPALVPASVFENGLRPVFRCVADSGRALGLSRTHLEELYRTTRELMQEADGPSSSKQEERMVRLAELIEAASP